MKSSIERTGFLFLFFSSREGGQGRMRKEEKENLIIRAACETYHLATGSGSKNITPTRVLISTADGKFWQQYSVAPELAT